MKEYKYEVYRGVDMDYHKIFFQAMRLKEGFQIEKMEYWRSRSTDQAYTSMICENLDSLHEAAKKIANDLALLQEEATRGLNKELEMAVKLALYGPQETRNCFLAKWELDVNYGVGEEAPKFTIKFPYADSIIVHAEPTSLKLLESAIDLWAHEAEKWSDAEILVYH